MPLGVFSPLRAFYRACVRASSECMEYGKNAPFLMHRKLGGSNCAGKNGAWWKNIFAWCLRVLLHACLLPRGTALIISRSSKTYRWGNSNMKMWLGSITSIPITSFPCVISIFSCIFFISIFSNFFSLFIITFACLFSNLFMFIGAKVRVSERKTK